MVNNVIVNGVIAAPTLHLKKLKHSPAAHAGDVCGTI